MALGKDGVFRYATETHYDQLDGQMVLHHPRYFVFVERAQQVWVEAMLNAPRFDWKNFPDMYLVVRRLEAEYIQSINGELPIVVSIWPESIRAAKLTMGFKIHSPDEAVIYCRGTRVNCKVDLKTHQPAFWSDAFRSAVEREIGVRKSHM